MIMTTEESVSFPQHKGREALRFSRADFHSHDILPS